MMLLSIPTIPSGTVLPVLVFVAETCVVTLGTVRTIFLARGMKTPAACLGFFEVSIWLFAIGQVMQNLTSLDCYLAFASGFSLGNFLGVLIEKKLALGNVVVHITTRKDAGDLIESLRCGGYGTTALDAHGTTGPVRVVFSVIKRKELTNVVAIIKRFDHQAFYSVNDLQSAAARVLSPARRGPNLPVPLSVQQVWQVVAGKVRLWKPDPLQAAASNDQDEDSFERVGMPARNEQPVVRKAG